MSNFITPDWLHNHLDDENLIIVDCRADLFDKEYGKRKYQEGHIKGAFFVDVKKDLAAESKAHGGRSPLPELEILKEKLESIGISNDKVIVAYDEALLAGAERFWWMLKFLGHEKVHILTGGINAWIEAGYTLVKEASAAEKGKFIISPREDIRTDVNYVKNNLDNKNILVIDSRAPERYRGEIEPIDPKAGHIPGAKNYHWKDVLDEKGCFKSKEDLKKIFKGLEQYDEVVLQCGSGIDACGNFVAMDEIGLKPKLYVGSWSDWVSYEDNPVATGGK
jgi:thiosulfate/3-mercaptopyruvate sulfurtransferase